MSQGYSIKILYRGNFALNKALKRATKLRDELYILHQERTVLHLFLWQDKGNALTMSKKK